MQPNNQNLKSIKENMDRHLYDIISFWQQRCWDQEFGGFLTNFDENGDAKPNPEKYLNTQARMVWWYSALALHFPEQKEYLTMAEKGVSYLIEKFWDRKNGGWNWKINREGNTIDSGKIVYGQSFAIYALATYELAKRDKRGLHYAEQTFDLLQKHCADTYRGGYFENFEERWDLGDPGFGGGDRKTLDTHMHLMESFTVLYQASNMPLHLRKLIEVIDLIAEKMIDPTSGCGRNHLSLDFKPIPAIAIKRTWNAEREGESPDIPIDSTSYGHNTELSWLLNRAIEVAGIDPAPYQKFMSKLLDHAVSNGLDREYGGIFRDGVSVGDAVILEKEFWQNAECLVGFLDGYQTFSSQTYLDAFVNIWNFVNNHMINHSCGEWKTLLDRKGNPLDPNIGNPWKVAYHSGRSILECCIRLDSIIG